MSVCKILVLLSLFCLLPPSFPLSPAFYAGVNKYSHDTTLCILSKDGVWMSSKERFTRRKHDGGDISLCTEEWLEGELGIDGAPPASMVTTQNNHHFPISIIDDPTSYRSSVPPSVIGWSSSLGYSLSNSPSLSSPLNLLPNPVTIEHHIAHAFSAVAVSGMYSGIISIMDGMGDTWDMGRQEREGWEGGFTAILQDDGNGVILTPGGDSREPELPKTLTFRESESFYKFKRTKSSLGFSLTPILKRYSSTFSAFTPSHGFEYYNSLGGAYSRVSSHIFGDWNACGKVMGVYPYGKQRKGWVVRGSVTGKEGVEVNYGRMEGRPLKERVGEDEIDFVERFKGDGAMGVEGWDVDAVPNAAVRETIELCHDIQLDLNEMVIRTLEEVKGLAREMGGTENLENLVLAGGVALNSVTNGILKTHHSLYRNVYIPPFVGDEGIAFGAAVKGAIDSNGGEVGAARISEILDKFEPYTGSAYGEEEIQDAIDDFGAFVNVVDYTGKEDELVAFAAGRIAEGDILAWYHGRSEVGPRALGHRSILGDPRNGKLVEFINKKIKVRENFRPFAPSVLKEYVGEWFEWEGDGREDVSPYMSLTLQARENKREQIPAVIHVDGSSRIQSVDGTRPGTRLYHKLIEKFRSITGVPMVLNTSFNTIKGEPIVEKPRGAMVSFLIRSPHLRYLVLGNYVLERKVVEVGESDVLDVSGGFSLTTRERFWGGDDAGSVEEATVRMQGLEEWGDVSIDGELGGDVLALCDGTRTTKNIADEMGAEAEDIVEVVRDLEEKMLVKFVQ